MNDGFHKWWVFWLAALMPIFVAAFCAWFISRDIRLVPDYSYQGLVVAYKYMKLPLLISALSFPLVALVASIHRSAQTHKQIALAIEQNLFSNYLKHKEEFSKMLASLQDVHNVIFKSPASLYRKIFPGNGYQFLDVQVRGGGEGNVIDNFYRDIAAIYGRIDSIQEGRSFDPKTLRNFYTQLFMCGEFLDLYFKEPDSVKKLYWANDWQIAFSSSNILKHSRVLLDLMSTISYFAGYTGSIFVGTKEPFDDFRIKAIDIFSKDTENMYLDAKSLCPDLIKEDGEATAEH